jgi:signal transduction histidine kinase/DNA-binding response OmpR family regulator/streptogramin lyase
MFPCFHFHPRKVLHWLALPILLASHMVHSAGSKPVQSYRSDPLAETWRWQRVEDLEGNDLTMIKIDPDGHLGIINGSNRLVTYDGLQLRTITPPEGLVQGQVNAFGISSTGVHCLVTPTAIFLHDHGEWTKLADVGKRGRNYDAVVETADGILWVGLSDGIARIDPETKTCNITPSSKRILSICEGPDRDSLWISTGRFGAVWECPLVDGRLVPEEDWIQRFGGWERDVLINSLLRSSDGRIWYVNNNHNLPASYFEPATGTWESVNLSRLGGDNFDFSIIESDDGAIWISSRGSLHVLRNSNWQVYHSPEYPIPGARSSIFKDPDGYIYLAEESGMNVRIDYAQQQGQVFNDILFQAETASGDRLFISVDNEVVHFPEGSGMAILHGPAETGINAPGSLIVHSNGDWILAGSHERQAAVSIWDGSRWTPRYYPDFSASFGHLSLMEHSSGDVWLGCAQLEAEFPQFEGGIIVLRPEGKGAYTGQHLRPPDFNFRNWSLNEGPDGEVYSSGNGLFTNTLQGAQALNLPEPMLYKWLDEASVDDEGRLWVALWSHGVFVLENDQWRQFTSEDGLESPLVSYITNLDGNATVATTREGHYRFDGSRWAPYMGLHDGLHRGSGRLLQARDGSIWINHTHVDWYYRGLRSEAYAEDKKRGFRTVQYVPDTNPPETFWSEVPPELTRAVNMHFSWSGKDAWSRSRTDDLHYAYRVDDGDWSPFLPITEVRLENLKGGAHSIEIRARDTDFNVDPTPLRAEFTVIIPVWQQGWFIASLVAVVILLVVMVILFIRQRVKHLIEIEQVKMRFFTHLSHEIKTPLSLIMGPVERLQNEVSNSRHQHYLSLIKSNSQRLLFLINQLLDFRKFQLEKLEFKPEEGDFIPYVRSCLAVFEGWAQEKGQEMVFETDREHLVFQFDQEMFHKIIDNLVNNAVKYTQPGGRVRLRVSVEELPEGRFGRIEVEDDGPGIRKSEQESIFEPFYRSGDHDEFEEGAGIGLAFVKELVELLDGSITVESPIHPDRSASPGSRFSVRIPLPGYAAAHRPPAAPAPVAETAPSGSGSEAMEHEEIVLLIEDNHDLRQFIGGELEESFRIVTAENGMDGIARAKELIPDLVISDVVMPGMSGFEASRELKLDGHTSHIPVILLTALRSEEHKRQAYESGADDFITKPVSSEILRLKVRNLLATQKRSRERARQQFVDDHRISGLSEADQAFLDRADALVEEHLGMDQFDVSELAEKMGFSRSAFYRKFNSLTDMSPAAFIRTKRLRKAALWLAEGSRTVTEIAYDVGFSDAGYFSRIFKEEFKCSPSEFRKRAEPVES